MLSSALWPRFQAFRCIDVDGFLDWHRAPDRGLGRRLHRALWATEHPNARSERAGLEAGPDGAQNDACRRLNAAAPVARNRRSALFARPSSPSQNAPTLDTSGVPEVPLYG